MPNTYLFLHNLCLKLLISLTLLYLLLFLISFIEIKDYISIVSNVKFYIHFFKFWNITFFAFLNTYFSFFILYYSPYLF